ncbi:hypothetical protein EDC01DRAFT_727200 [Geopyxis carbonaria]|nr:hypothetical protein EDC01DRAFT_727200 [Geopyxis carbonaria]
MARAGSEICGTGTVEMWIWKGCEWLGMGAGLVGGDIGGGGRDRMSMSMSMILLRRGLYCYNQEEEEEEEEEDDTQPQKLGGLPLTHSLTHGFNPSQRLLPPSSLHFSHIIHPIPSQGVSTARYIGCAMYKQIQRVASGTDMFVNERPGPGQAVELVRSVERLRQSWDAEGEEKKETKTEAGGLPLTRSSYPGQRFPPPSTLHFFHPTQRTRATSGMHT